MNFNDIDPIRLRCIVPLRTPKPRKRKHPLQRETLPSAEEITGLSEDTLKRRYRHLIRKLSDRRAGMPLGTHWRLHPAKLYPIAPDLESRPAFAPFGAEAVIEGGDPRPRGRLWRSGRGAFELEIVRMKHSLLAGYGGRQGTRDRAAVVAITIISIIVDALRGWLHGEPADLAGVRTQIESLLRDEFADIKREVAGEREIHDA